MGTTVDKLNRLINTKEGVRQEINRAYGSEEISILDTFKSYIQKLEEHPYYLKGILDGSIENIKNSNATSIGEAAFRGCTSLTNVSFPIATGVGMQAFYGCSKLTNASFPKATGVGMQAFYGCSKLTNASFPKATGIGNQAFKGCQELITIYVGTESSQVCTLGTYAFSDCNNLTNIYVPSSLVNSYKSATNWSDYSSIIKAAP